MSLGTIATIAYGILAIIGGIAGYVKAQSRISLMAGVGSGILLLLGAFLQVQGFGWALIFSLFISVVLVIAFVGRYIKTKQFMPAGLMIILGVFAIVAMIYQLLGGAEGSAIGA